MPDDEDRRFVQAIRLKQATGTAAGRVRPRSLPFGLRPNVHFSAGFSDAGTTNRSTRASPGVREAPRHEVAGGGALTVQLVSPMFPDRSVTYVPGLYHSAT